MGIGHSEFNNGDKRTVRKKRCIAMKDANGTPDRSKAGNCDTGNGGTHHHRGKSSESLLDKDVILRVLDIKPGQTILDAGCGNGYMAKEFSQRVGDAGMVYALDPDDISISCLQRETEGANIVSIVGDITVPTELPASAFDLIYLSTVVHGFSSEQMQGFTAEAKRLLAPAGRLAIVEIVKRATPFGPPVEMRLSPDELENTLGLKAVDLVDVGEYFYLQIFQSQPGT